MRTNHLIQFFLIASLLAPLLVGCSGGLPDIASNTRRGANATFEAAEKCPFDLPEYANKTPTCGYMIAPVDRSKAQGPTVELPVVIFKTAAKEPRADPLLVLFGGPMPVVNFSWQFGYMFESLLADRDLIVMEQRGVGLSEPALECPEAVDLFYESVTDRLNSADIRERSINLQRNCYQKFVDQEINLAAYTTAASAADLADLRAVMNIKEWNIYSFGYGARLALELMRQDPDGIRSAVMESVIPFNADQYTEQITNAQAALKLLFSRCAADGQCNQAFPNLEGTFYDVIKQLNTHPINLRSPDARNGQGADVLVDGDRFLLYTLSILASTYMSSTPQVPRMINQVSQGKTQQLSEFVNQNQILSNFEPISVGMQMLTFCEDAWPLTSKEKIDQAAKSVAPVIGDLFKPNFESDTTSCTIWKPAEAIETKKDEVTSGVPTLILTGDYNWYAPPAWAKDTAKGLSRSTVAEFPGGGQFILFDSVWQTCGQDIVKAFITDPLNKPDTTCTQKTQKTTWVTLP